MKLFLTSSIGATKHENGKRVPARMDNRNLFVDNLKKAIQGTNKLVYISGNPDYNTNEKVKIWFNNTIKSLEYENIRFKENIFVDYKNSNNISDIIKGADIIFLSGGALPVQNNFFNEINLKEYIKDYDGIIVAQSAGSMNCAENVYICPETLEEVNNINFIREAKGLGLTNINIIPHYNSNKEFMFGAKRFYQDIIYPDTFKFCIYILTDGSYIYINERETVVYGECYVFYRGTIKNICSNGNDIILD